MCSRSRYITANVPISETGTATLGMRVARGLRRKMKTTSTTRMMEPIRVVSTLLTDARMVVVRSMHDRRLDALGKNRFEKRQLRLDAVDRLDDVGARLAENDDEHRLRAVHVAARCEGSAWNRPHRRHLRGAPPRRGGSRRSGACTRRFGDLVVGDDVLR